LSENYIVLRHFVDIEKEVYLPRNF